MLLVATAVSACNLRRPEVTLTLAPIDTRTPEATDVRELPTQTLVKMILPTPTATALPTEPAPTAQPQLADTPAPTATEAGADDIIDQLPPEFTPLPTLNQTEIAQLLATPVTGSTLPPTWTAAPTLPPTDMAPTPTAIATASVDIATPNINQISLDTPLPATPLSQLDAPTPTPSPTRVQPTVAGRWDLLPSLIPPPVSQPNTFSISGASAYQYDVSFGQDFSFENIRLSGGVRLFLPNPVDPNSFLRTNAKGVLNYKPIGALQEGEMTFSPFHSGYAGGIASIEQNKHRIVELDWSADGRQFSFRIDTPPGLDNSAAGVWFWQPQLDAKNDATYQIIRDCAQEGYKPCDFVYPSIAKYWKTIGVQWSPMPGSNAILLTLRLPEEKRNALAIARALRDSSYANHAPEMIRYDYGYWNQRGQGITVSGRRPDGQVIIGLVNNDLSGERIILNGSARGLWLRDAARLPDGQYVALGRPGAPGSGPVALYDQAGDRLSEFIGGAAPADVRWYADRSAVVVSAQGRQYTVSVADAVVTDVTDLALNPRFSETEAGIPPIPSGVVAGAAYSPGQQLRISIPSLNIREAPSTTSAVIARLYAGDYVAVFAGPHENEGHPWWRIQTANNVFGWIAGAIDGRPTMRPA